MAATKFVLFFRNEINLSLLLDSANKVEAMARIENLKRDLSKMEGINFFKEWEQLFATIMKTWEEDRNAPVFKLEEKLLNKLAFSLDLIAQLVLSNNSEQDNNYLKAVDTFFKQHNKQRGKKNTQDLFDKAFK